MAIDTTLVKGKYILTGSPNEPGWKKNAGIIFHKDRIVEVGQADDLQRKYAPDTILGGDEFLVMPGLVNAHYHGRGLSSFQMGSRDDALEPWIYEIWTEPGTDLFLNALYGAVQLIASGVTTVIHSHYHSPVEPEKYLESANILFDAYHAAGIRARVALGIKDQNLLVYGNESGFIDSLPSPLREKARWLAEADIEPQPYFQHFERLYHQYQNHPRLSAWLGPEGIQWCSDDLLCRVAKTAEAFDVGVHMHGVESPLQRIYGKNHLAGDSIVHLEEIGFLQDRVSIAHGVWVSENDIHALARTGATVVPNPASNLRLKNGIAPLAQLKKAGVNLALGMDGMGMNDDNDYHQEAQLGYLVNQLPGSPKLSPSDLFDMMTRGGARAARLSDCVGCLKPGYYADLVLVRWDEITFPYVSERQNPIDVLIYRGRARHVDTVIIGGEVVLQNKKFIHHNMRKIARKLVHSISYPIAGSPGDQFLQIAKELRPYVEAYYRNWSSTEIDPFCKPNSRI